MIARWWIYWGPSMLRLVAFNHDLHCAHAVHAKKPPKGEGKGEGAHAVLLWERSRPPPAEWSYDWREEAHQPLEQFGAARAPSDCHCRAGGPRYVREIGMAWRAE
jgi:hypothetical protein